MNKYVKKSVLKMRGYVPGEQPGNGSVIKLNTNENPYPPSPKVRKVLAQLSLEKLRLYPDPESRGLRNKIAVLHKCDVRRVFVGNGSDEILALCTRAFVEDSGSIGYFEPSYSLYPVLARIRDVAVRPLKLDGHFEWRMPPGYSCSLFFLANPNAPTGILYSAPLVRSFCRRFKGLVVIDEAYVDFSRADCMDLARGCGNVLVLRTLSKSYSLAGIRLGYAIGSPPLIEALYKVKDSYNVSRLTQEIAMAALSDQAYMRRNRERIRRTRRRLSRELGKMNFKVFPSEANFLWVKPSRISARILYRRLRVKNILVRFFPGSRTSSFLRITIGTDKQVNALLACLKSIVTSGGMSSAGGID